jgi:hypothetical protein
MWLHPKWPEGTVNCLNTRFFDCILTVARYRIAPTVDAGNFVEMKSLPIQSRAAAALVLALAFASAPAIAMTVDVDFEGETPFLIVPNGYSTGAAPLVSFSDTVGANLQLVVDPVRTNNSIGLAVFDDADDSGLLIELAFFASALSLDYGNDSALHSAPGDAAVLTLFLGGVEVASVSQAMNRNDAMDQTLGFDGALAGIRFDSAIFKFDVAPGLGLTEVVDHVSVTPVPEASAATSFGLGLLAAGLSIRHVNFNARGRCS